MFPGLVARASAVPFAPEMRAASFVHEYPPLLKDSSHPPARPGYAFTWRLVATFEEKEQPPIPKLQKPTVTIGLGTGLNPE